MPAYPATPLRGHLYWAQMPYLPERPLDVLRSRPGKGEVRAALTFKTRPVLIVQNRMDNANSAYPFVIVAAVHSIKPGELEKLRRINHPTDFLLSPAECGLKQPSVVFFNSPHIVQQPTVGLSVDCINNLLLTAKVQHYAIPTISSSQVIPRPAT